jgi:hypothetical protein
MQTIKTMIEIDNNWVSISDFVVDDMMFMFQNIEIDEYDADQRYHFEHMFCCDVEFRVEWFVYFRLVKFEVWFGFFFQYDTAPVLISKFL